MIGVGFSYEWRFKYIENAVENGMWEMVGNEVEWIYISKIGWELFGCIKKKFNWIGTWYCWDFNNGDYQHKL
jgi:hypothetical protein